MSLLDAALAQRFIDKTAKNLEFNINIMNEKGIIIASKDSTRLGDFHEVAHGIITGVLETGVVNEERKYMNTKPGVNLCIEYKNQNIGVICVTGNPENVNAFAYLVKTSLETMLEYESQMENKRYRRNKMDQFIYYLLFEEHMDINIANKMADRIEIQKDVSRVIIIIENQGEYETHILMKALVAANGHSHNDLISVNRNNNIIIAKAIPKKEFEIIFDFRNFILSYIDDFYDKMNEPFDRHQFKFYVGTLQDTIGSYRDSYIHAQEMSLRIQTSGVHFFNDHVLDYFRGLVNMNIYNSIFNIYDKLFTDDEKNMLAETVEVLSHNNYNVVNSAKELFVHRNTLVFRLNKIKSSLGIDPISNAAEREFLNELAYYFRNK